MELIHMKRDSCSFKIFLMSKKMLSWFNPPKAGFAHKDKHKSLRNKGKPFFLKGARFAWKVKDMKEKEDELKKIKVGLYTVDQRTAIEKREAIYLVPVENIERSGKLVRIKISDNPVCAGKKDERQAFEFNPDPSFWRWPAGGAAIIIRTFDPKSKSGYAYSLLTLLRDEGAVTYANHATLSTGLGCSTEEIKMPMLILREAFEELVIKTPEGIVCPFFDEDDQNSKIDIESIVRIGMDLRTETKDLKLIKTRASVLKGLPGEKEIEVEWRREKNTCRGLLVEDKGVHGLDVLQVVMISLDCRSDELEIFDGEVIGKKNLLNREIYGYGLDENLVPTGSINSGWRSGKYFAPKSGTVFPIIPVLKFVLEQLNTRRP